MLGNEGVAERECVFLNIDIGLIARFPKYKLVGIEPQIGNDNAALRDDWQAYASAWAALDALEAKDLLARQSAGEVVRLSLCGERSALTFQSAPRSLRGRFTQLLKPKPLLGLLETL